MNEFIQTMLIACVPAVVSGVGTFIVTHRSTDVSLKQFKESNKQEINRLIKQHEIDIDALREKYRLESEQKEREHQYRIELLEKEFEMKFTQQEKEAERRNSFHLSLLRRSDDSLSV